MREISVGGVHKFKKGYLCRLWKTIGFLLGLTPRIIIFCIKTEMNAKPVILLTIFFDMCNFPKGQE